MANTLSKTSNQVYRRQVAVMVFFMTITYKVVMLPRFLAIAAPRDFVIGIGVRMLIEILMYSIVFLVIFRCRLESLIQQRWLYVCVLLCISISSATKLIVLLVETLDYISTLLFQEGRWLFIILTLMPALSYIAYKGINTIARVSEIIVWAVMATFLFTLIFLQAKVEITNLFPLFDNGVESVAEDMMRHSMWFGDFLPFLLLDVKPGNTKLDRVAIPIGLIVTYVLTFGFYLLFISIYGEIAPYIKFAFSNIGVYNSISSLLGGVDFPIVCVWLLMAIVKLSFLLYSILFSIDDIIKPRNRERFSLIVSIVISLIIMLILSFGISSVKSIYAFAVGSIRYVILGIDYSIPLLLLILLIVKNRHTSNKVNVKITKRGKSYEST